MRSSLLLRSPDGYDPLQICLQEIGSQEIRLLMMPSAVGSVFIIDDMSQSAIGALIELPSFIDSIRRSVPPLLPWSRCDALELILRPPLGPIEMLRAGSPHSTGSSSSHPGRNDEDITPVASCFSFLSLF